MTAASATAAHATLAESSSVEDYMALALDKLAKVRDELQLLATHVAEGDELSANIMESTTLSVTLLLREAQAREAARARDNDPLP